MKTLAEVFNAAFQHVKFDAGLAKRIYNFHISYVNTNKEHLEFYGGNLLGVHVVRFKDSDLAKFFDILDVDHDDIKQAIKAVPSVVQGRLVSSDTLNLTCMYLIHRFKTSPYLTPDQRLRAAYDVSVVFFMRALAAILSAWFRYPADPKIAQSAYAHLSGKFLIKKLGSWHKVIDYRAKDLSGVDSLHHKALTEFKHDVGVLYAITDSAGRISDAVKGYYAILVSMSASGNRISATSSTMLDVEGNEIVRDYTNSVESYVQYLSSIIPEEHAFIKQELMGVVHKLNVNTSVRMIRSTLEWMSNKYNEGQYHELIDKFIKSVIVYGFSVINDPTKISNIRDYPTILLTIKNNITASRSTDPVVLELRDVGARVVRLSDDSGQCAEQLILATRTAVALYLILRTLIGKKK